MNITVKAFENADPDSAIKAHVNMTIDNAFVVKNLAVVQGKNGLFLNMPHHKSNEVDENGKVVYKDDAFPLNKDLRDKLQDAAVSSYQKGGQEVGFTFDTKEKTKTSEKSEKEGARRTEGGRVSVLDELDGLKIDCNKPIKVTMEKPKKGKGVER